MSPATQQPAAAGAVPSRLPVAVRLRPTSRGTLLADVADLLAADYRCLVVTGENVPDGVRLGYLFARPAGAGTAKEQPSTAGEDRVELVLEVPVVDAWVPTVAALSYPGGRFEREIRDLFGVEPRDHPLPRRLVRHAHWPRGWHPLLTGAGAAPDFREDVSAFPFIEVAGDGVYEIPVGPVHAGLIEPGHFRFSVVGETIVRMKARLWYLHRGVERHFEGRVPDEGLELAERISGDTAVGHSVAYALACEEALGVEVPHADRLLRCLLLELERLYNHAGDLAAILNDVAFGLANSHLLRVRENLLRLNASVTGHRLLRGAVRVGGTQVSALPDVAVVRTAAADVAEVVRLALDHPMVLDRLVGTAVLGRDDAVRMGTLGYVARASGVHVDARRDHPFVDLGLAAPAGGPEVAVERRGDVRARLLVRSREVAASARLAEALVDALGAPGPVAANDSAATGPDERGRRRGLGVVEAWRGLLCHRVTVGADGRLARVKVVDPSFMNWPALPVALTDTIVPDFPLANKSFNQSYAGNDL